MLVFTMLALIVIDHFGRRKLMIAGSIGYIISLSAIAWAFYTYGADFKAFLEHGTPVSGIGSQVVLWGLIAFVAAHGFGQGAVIWVYISEVFPNRVREAARTGSGFIYALVHGCGHLMVVSDVC